MADAQPSQVSVGDLPPDLRQASPRLDREQHILIRRDRPELPRDDEGNLILDDGPDVDPETGAVLPSVHRMRSGNIRRDF